MAWMSKIKEVHGSQPIFWSMAAMLHNSVAIAVAVASITASHDNHEKINPWVSFFFLYDYGAPSGRRSSSINIVPRK